MFMPYTIKNILSLCDHSYFIIVMESLIKVLHKRINNYTEFVPNNMVLWKIFNFVSLLQFHSSFQTLFLKILF